MPEKKRKHNPKWQDNTRNTRQKKRREVLNQAARLAGWESWSKYETAIINNKVQITPR